MPASGDLVEGSRRSVDDSRMETDSGCAAMLSLTRLVQVIKYRLMYCTCQV